MPINYQSGKIYKIVDYTTNKIYVGSTCKPYLANRLADHVAKYNAYLKGKIKITTSGYIIQNGNYDMVLIENYPCNSKDELHQREAHYISTLENVINKHMPNIYNRLGVKEYEKQRHLKRMENKIFCECGGHYTCNHKLAHLRTKRHLKYLETL